MEFIVSKESLQKELGFVQGVVEKKNVIPVLSNILIESTGENTILITGTDLDMTIRCEVVTEGKITGSGSMCIPARKLFEIARLLPDGPVRFKQESGERLSIRSRDARFKMAGFAPDAFPKSPSVKPPSIELPAGVIHAFIDRTIFAITQEESRYTLSGAKFVLDDFGLRMITTDGHRLAYVERTDISRSGSKKAVDVLIPRKALAELAMLTADLDEEISLGVDENHICFQVGPRLLISRLLYGQFPKYEMVMPKNNDKSVELDSGQLNLAIKRVALMADERSHAVRLHFEPNRLVISAASAEETEAEDVLQVDYTGDEMDIAFNAHYLHDFFGAISGSKATLHFKDGETQAELKTPANGYGDYRYVVMPMRLGD